MYVCILVNIWLLNEVFDRLFFVSQKFFQDGARIEAAFRKYFYRAPPEQENDSYEIIVGHSNVIRYFVCRCCVCVCVCVRACMRACVCVCVCVVSGVWLC